MPSSTVSLEPLSSPSPSPPPPEETHTLSSNSNHSGAGAGFDSGSELSELTEDEQDNDSSQQVDEEHLHPTRRTGKKKRSIVPTPMWEWAYNKPKKQDWKVKLIEEEEEEEQSGPAKAMEEEEDEDHNDDDSHPDTTAPPEIDPADDDDDAHEEQEDAQDQEEDSNPPPLVTQPIPIETDDLLSGDEAEPEVDPKPDDAPPLLPGARVPSPDPTEDEIVEEDDTEDLRTNIEDDSRDPDPPVESEDEVDNVEESVTPNGPSTEVTTTPIIPTPVVSTSLVVDPSLAPFDGDPTVTPMEVDDADPTPAQPSPVAAIVAASSIMAGSEVVNPPSPSASASTASGTPRVSPFPSRSPTPEAGSDHEAETKASTSRTTVEVTATVTRKAKNVRSTRSRPRRRTKAELALEHDHDADLPVDADDHTVADPDDAEVDSPELELDSDVQPAHRSEALDMLAQIELKFALLRERLYVEKMEGLAWEEALLTEGTHPEMSHLHAELSKRRDKRLELASRRREYEVANITKRRKLDEDGVWSWWKNSRESLQVEMASEANRRRRKLDRERRAIDRPQPIRRIPSAPHIISTPSTLRDVIKALPYDGPSDNLTHKTRRFQGSVAHPRLITLTPEEVLRDLDFLHQQGNQIAGYDLPRTGSIGPNAIFGQPPGMRHTFEPFNMGMPLIDGPGLARFGPPPMQHFPPPHLQGPIPPGFPGPLGGPIHRMQNHSAPPTAMGSISHSHIILEADLIGRPSSGAPPPGHFQSFSSNGPAHVPIHLPRRSISPVPVPHINNGTGPSMPSGSSSFSGASKPPSWMTVGTPGSSTLPGGTKEVKRLNGTEIGVPEREKDYGRERISEGTKLRDGRDREIESDREVERQFHMQRHAPLQHTHQHNNVSTTSGHAGQHHHHSHHHHVHHHHHPPSGPGGPSHQGPSSGGPPPMNGLGVNPSGLSPRTLRELELRRPPSGAPMEVIDLAPPPSTKATLLSPMGEEPSPQDLSRDRGRPPFGPHERIMSSFMIPPSPATMQSGFPRSPRNVAPAPSTTPGSIGPSRRSSWTEEQGLPRPGSSSSLGPPTLNHLPPNSAGPSSHRHTPLARLAMSPPLPPQRTPTMHSPPRSNGIRLPPLSPSAATLGVGGPHVRSPIRLGQALPPPPFATTNSPPKMTSPETKMRRHSPPLSVRSPLIREQLSGPINSLGSTSNHSVNPRTSSPINIFPPPSSLSVSPLPPRLPGVSGVVSGRHSPSLANAPKMNTVPPIDGS